MPIKICKKLAALKTVYVRIHVGILKLYVGCWMLEY